jgi:HPt (histidine-containing phosphotransfer) domain-containing protein
MLKQELRAGGTARHADAKGGEPSMSTPDDLSARLDALNVLDRDVVGALRDPDLGGDDAFLVEVIQAFVEDSPQHIQAIQAALVSGKGQALMRAAHSLKGSCGNFGAARLQALCAELEARGRQNQLDGLAPLVARVASEYALLKDHLRVLADEVSRSASTAH